MVLLGHRNPHASSELSMPTPPAPLELLIVICGDDSREIAIGCVDTRDVPLNGAHHIGIITHHVYIMQDYLY